jgi:hypothetical protein
MSKENCQKYLMTQDKPYPRTCAECGLSGPCKYFTDHLKSIGELTSRKVFVVYEAYSDGSGQHEPLAAFSEKADAALWIYMSEPTYNPALKIKELDLQ